MTTLIVGEGESAGADAAAHLALERSFRGHLIRPGDPSYELRRKVWNGSIDRHPSLIARCANVRDVVVALAFGRELGMEIAVRSGGHSFPGLSVCDGGLVIDLGAMKRIDVDPTARIVRAQAGVVLGELDQATQAFGLAVPTGSVSHRASRADTWRRLRLADAQVWPGHRSTAIGRGRNR